MQVYREDYPIPRSYLPSAPCSHTAASSAPRTEGITAAACYSVEPPHLLSRTTQRNRTRALLYRETLHGSAASLTALLLRKPQHLMLCLSRYADDANPNVTLDIAQLVNSCTESLPRFVDGGVESWISCRVLWCLEDADRASIQCWAGLIEGRGCALATHCRDRRAAPGGRRT